MSFVEIIRYVLKQIVESLEYIVWKALISGVRKAQGGIERVDGRPPERILLVQLNSIGDVLMSTPAIRALRERFPDGKIDVLAQPHTAVLLEGNPGVDGVLSYAARFWRRAISSPNVFKRSARTLKTLKKANYDICIDLGGTFGSAICSLFSGASCVVGPKRDLKSGIFTDSTENFYTRAVEMKEKHIVKRYLEIASELGCSAPDEKEEIFISGEEQKKAADLFDKNGLEKNSFAVIHPGAKWPPKRWPLEYYAELIRMMSDEAGIRSVLVGSPQEADLLETIKDKSGVPETVLVFGLGLKELGGVISGARVFIGNDSGPAHIADAAGTPSVLLFGPTDPGECAPISEKVTVLHDKISCWPCTLYFRRDRCEAGVNTCLRNIKPEQVLAVARELMRG